MIDLFEEEIREAVKTDRDFRRLYDHYAPYVWRIVYRTVHGNGYLAELAIQQVFIIVHRTLGRFQFKSAFSTWLYQIAWRESIRVAKQNRRRRERETTLPETVSVQDSSDQEREVIAILDRLSPEDRFLIVSREIDGFSFEELETITGKKSGALRTAVSRIKQKIREELHD